MGWKLRTDDEVRLRAKVATLEARVKELEDALRPFAAFASTQDVYQPDHIRLNQVAGLVPMPTVGDCRAAKRALTPEGRDG